MRSLSFIVALALLAASCAAPAPEPTPAPRQPVVTIPVAPPPSAAPVQPKGDWIDWPITAGSWVYRQDARGSIALFGPAGQNALLTLRCDKARRALFLSRASAKATGRLTLRTSASMKTFEARNSGATPPYLAVELAANDAILDAIAFSRGRFAVQTEGELSVAIPAWAEIGPVVEDCRA